MFQFKNNRYTGQNREGKRMLEKARKVKVRKEVQNLRDENNESRKIEKERKEKDR